MTRVRSRRLILRSDVWTVVGVAITLLALAFAVYTHYREKSAEVTIEITNQTDALDIHEPVDQLSIFFQGENIYLKGLNLRFYTIRFENTGEVDILQSHFDNNIPWGLRLTDARAVRVLVKDSNDEYLKESLNPRIINENLITLEKVIFERGKVFSIELLTLCGNEKSPHIEASGKIAGIDSLYVADRSITSDSSRWQELLSGSLVVHGLRAILYCLCFALFSGGIIVVVGGCRLVKARHRKELIEAILKSSDIHNEVSKNTAKALYVSFGKKGICCSIELMNDLPRLAEEVELTLKNKRITRQLAKVQPYPPPLEGITVFTSPHTAIVQVLLDEGAVILSGKTEQGKEEVSIAEEVQHDLRELHDRLR